MIDAVARVWERTGDLIVATPVPVRPFIEEIKAHCRGARYHPSGWIVPPGDGDTAVAILRTYFPIVQDTRQTAPPAPPFVDGHCDDPFALLDRVNAYLPVAPALCDIFNDRHPARTAFAQLAAEDTPVSLLHLGFAESLDSRWVIAFAAQRFWHEWLRRLPQLMQSSQFADGTLCETITAAGLQTAWQQTRTQICGADLPRSTGQRWVPPTSSLPHWVAALLATTLVAGGPPFTRDPAAPRPTQYVTRILPPWPMRLRSELHRLDLKDAAHWPISVCVLPGRQSRNGSDTLLHLSAVGGLSKNRALWAAILDGRREQIPLRAGGQRHYPRRAEGRQQYVTDWNDQPLDTSGLSHLALTHHSAFEPELGQPFLHLAGNDTTGAPDLPLFAQQLSRAISVPFDLAWAAQLWAYATDVEAADAETALITPLPSTGCQGYWVLADEARWTRLIVAVQQGVTPASLGDDDLVITEIGAALRIDGIVEQTGEGGDEVDDDE